MVLIIDLLIENKIYHLFALRFLSLPGFYLLFENYYLPLINAVLNSLFIQQKLIFLFKDKIPVRIETVVRISDKSCFQSVNQLLKPSIMMIEDMETIDETYVVSKKLNGERALMTVLDCEMILDFGYRREVTSIFPDVEFVADVEVVHGKIYCLDILWVNKTSVIHLDLRQRLKSIRIDTAAAYQMILQQYVFFGSQEASDMIRDCEEGVIIQSALSPYIKQYTRIYKIKREETIDLKVEGKSLVVEEPIKQVIAEVTELLNNSSIVEYSYERRQIVKYRPDKLIPNSSQIVARAVSPLRVTVDDIYDYSLTEKRKSHRELKSIMSLEKRGAVLMDRMNCQEEEDPYEVWKIKEWGATEDVQVEVVLDPQLENLEQEKKRKT